MVNKRDIEVFIVCLSCHFDIEKLSYHWAGGTPLAFSMIHVCLQWQELIWDLSRVAWGLGTHIQATWDFQLMVCQAYKLIFALTLTLIIQDAYDRGNESAKLMSTIIFGSFIKLVNPYFPLRRAYLFYFYVESVNLFISISSKHLSCCDPTIHMLIYSIMYFIFFCLAQCFYLNGYIFESYQWP
jgi:hypothetical protein